MTNKIGFFLKLPAICAADKLVHNNQSPVFKECKYCYLTEAPI